MMVLEVNTADITANGGGENSSTGNTLVYDLPDSSRYTVTGIVKKIVIDNATGAAGRVLLTDSDDTSTNMPAVAELAFEVDANETLILTESDLPHWEITSGIVAQASNGATSPGYKIRVEVDVRK